MIKLASALVMAAGLVAANSSGHWTATLRSTDTRNVTGTADVESVGTDSAKISVSVDNAPAGTVLHWRLASGSCADNGTIVGNEKAYPALRTPEGATKAEVKATLALMLQPGTQYVVQVIGPVPAPSLKEDPKMAADKTHMVACGELQPSSMNPSN